MPPTTIKSAYWRGVRDGLPFILMAVPFAILFGVLASEAGLKLTETMAMTLLVIAGAAQFTALQLMVEDAALPLILLASLAVNLRMAMYSAALVPHLGAAPLWKRALVAYLNFDQTFVMSVAEYDARPNSSLRDKLNYFFGVATPLFPSWVAATLLGALVGSAIPERYALDFVMPIMFLAMVAPMIKSVAHLAAVIVSAVVALALAGLPSGLGLLIAAFLAMVTGVLVETWRERQQ